MTRFATAVALCAIGLVVAAGAVVVLGEPDLLPASAKSPAPTPSVSIGSNLSGVTETPTVTTAPPIPLGPLTVADATAVLPKAGEAFAQADPAVELGSVCEGATLDVVGATAVYASLQTTGDPLQFVDAVVAVYDTAPAAAAAYDRIAEAIEACPPARTVTAAPTAPDATPQAVEVEGEVRPHVLVEGQSGVQWVQIQTADGTQLRTAITVVVVENALIAVSLDQDSETTEADDLAAGSVTHAAAIVRALLAAT